MQRSRRDSKLIDALDELQSIAFAGTIWRVVREGRDPCICNASGGRWDDATFDVLYTSGKPDGAVAQLYFHLKRCQTVFPARIRYRLHELTVRLNSVLDLSDPNQPSKLGVDMGRFGQLSYQERAAEYPRTQEIAEIAHMLDHDGILVASARWDCKNIIVFCDRRAPASLNSIKDHGQIDWDDWAAKNTARLDF
jgi:RES domain-containing protein